MVNKAYVFIHLKRKNFQNYFELTSLNKSISCRDFIAIFFKVATLYCYKNLQDYCHLQT